MLNPKLTYFDRYLKVAPFSLALWRAIEAGEIAKIKYRRPVLDIGCGFGEFAGIFFKSGVEVGVDISPPDLIMAKNGGKYQKLFLADARKLPFADQTFSTILSVSVLEHIARVDLAIKETFRVLKRGGLLIFTVPTNKLYDCLFYTRLLENLRLPGLAKLYFRVYNQLFKHVVMISQEEWGKMVKKAGFRITYVKEIIPQGATRLFDIFLVTALPSQIGRIVLGKRLVWALTPKAWFLKKLFLPWLIAEDGPGSNIIMVAQKP